MYFYYKTDDSTSKRYQNNQTIRGIVKSPYSSNNMVVTLWQNPITGTFQFILDHSHDQKSAFQGDEIPNNEESLERISLIIKKSPT